MEHEVDRVHGGRASHHGGRLAGARPGRAQLGDLSDVHGEMLARRRAWGRTTRSRGRHHLSVPEGVIGPWRGSLTRAGPPSGNITLSRDSSEPATATYWSRSRDGEVRIVGGAEIHARPARALDFPRRSLEPHRWARRHLAGIARGAGAAPGRSCVRALRVRTADGPSTLRFQGRWPATARRPWTRRRRDDFGAFARTCGAKEVFRATASRINGAWKRAGPAHLRRAHRGLRHPRAGAETESSTAHRRRRRASSEGMEGAFTFDSLILERTRLTRPSPRLCAP